MTSEPLPPHDIPAEESVLGALIIDGERISDIADLLRPDHFFREHNGLVYAQALALYGRHEAIDQVTLSRALEQAGQLRQVGGVAYLSTLASQVPTSLHIGEYARAIVRAASYRQMISLAGEIGRIGYEAGPDESAAMTRVHSAVLRLALPGHRGFRTLRELLDLFAMRTLLAPAERAEGALWSTGFIDLDRVLGGLHPMDLIVLGARPGMGKCLDEDSSVVLEDGSIRTIRQICEARTGRIMGVNDNLHLEIAAPQDFFDNGMQPVARLTTRLGRRITCTLNQPLLTVLGWQPLARLKAGQCIAVPRVMPVFGKGDLRECEAKLLAYLIGDGGVTGANPKFTNTNWLLHRDFAEAIAEFGGLHIRMDSRKRAPTACISSDIKSIRIWRAGFSARLRATLNLRHMSAYKLALELGVSPNTLANWTQGIAVPTEVLFESACRCLGVAPAQLLPEGHSVGDLRGHNKNRLRRWLESLGLWGKGSRDKYVPELVFTARKERIAIFLNRLFATDGWLSIYKTGQIEVGYSSVSEILVRQVQHLLLRFGVVASLRMKRGKYNGLPHQSWSLEITDACSLHAFLETIGIFSQETKVTLALSKLGGQRYDTNCDLLPTEVWDLLAKAKGDASWSDLARRVGLGSSGGGINLHVGKRRISRRNLRRFAVALGNHKLMSLAESAIYWDRIESVEYLGARHVFDLAMPGANFVANDIVVHNSALAMAIARHMALDQGARVAVFSLEMAGEQIAERMVSSESGVDNTRVRLGRFFAQDEASVMEAIGVLSEAQIHVDDTAVLSVADLRARALQLSAQGRVDCVMVDYMQLLNAGKRMENRTTEVTMISQALKALAREMHVPVLAVAQLSRGVEHRADRTPQLSDLRESGGIEQDADVVLLLHREAAYWTEESWHRTHPLEPYPRGISRVLIAKHRNGPTGEVKLYFREHLTRFENLARSED